MFVMEYLHRVDTFRHAPFTFQSGVDMSAVDTMLLRISDAQQRFVGSPLSSVAEQLEKEVAELKDKHLRMFAEFENFKKRTAKERIDLFRNAGLEFFESMLPILDDFDRAAKHREESDNSEELAKGIDLIQSKLIGILEQKGLKPMDSSIGKAFDTDFHEAITQIPAPSKDMKGKVIDETEKGYLLNDKVIRYAKVVVGQ